MGITVQEPYETPEHEFADGVRDRIQEEEEREDARRAFFRDRARELRLGNPRGPVMEH